MAANSVNWDEGFRRLATVVSGLYWGLCAIGLGFVFFGEMRDWYPGEAPFPSYYQWDWTNLSAAIEATAPNIGWAAAFYLVATVLWRGARWVIRGFQPKSGDA